MSDSNDSAIPLDLVPADHYDFLPGEEMFVRGRPARCVRFDYPHVYWSFTDEQGVLDANAAPNEACAEKHRSVSCNPEIFQVRREKKRGPPEEREHDDEEEEEAQEMFQQQQQQQQQQRAQRAADDDSSDEDEQFEQQAAAQAMAQVQSQQQEQGQHPESEQPQAPEAPSSDADVSDSRAGLLSAFSRLQPKVLFRGITDDSQETRINLRPSQSAEIEECARARFKVTGKVTAITLLKCEDVELEFLSAISQLNLINCRRCTIRCTQSCATYTIDDSEGCQVLFPGQQAQVLFVSTNSAGSVLRAVPGGEPHSEDDAQQPPPRALEAEVEHVVQEVAPQVAASEPPQSSEDSEGADAAATPVPPPQAPRQFRTEWKNDSAEFVTQPLVREGQLGYWQ